jgi:hypothetical protein
VTFESDTANVQFLQPPGPLSSGDSVDIYLNPTGKAAVTIVSGEKVVTAHLDPNQVFVSIDLGNTPGAPHYGARGMGFGAFLPGGNFDPAYPLGLEHRPHSGSAGRLAQLGPVLVRTEDAGRLGLARSQLDKGQPVTVSCRLLAEALKKMNPESEQGRVPQ